MEFRFARHGDCVFECLSRWAQRIGGAGPQRLHSVFSAFLVPQQLSYPVDCYNYPALVCCTRILLCGAKFHFPVCRRARTVSFVDVIVLASSLKQKKKASEWANGEDEENGTTHDTCPSKTVCRVGSAQNSENWDWTNWSARSGT